MIPNPDNDTKTDQEIEKTDHDTGPPLNLKLLEELRNLRSRAGIRVSMVIGYDGAILGIHEDAAYVPKVLRKGPHARSSKIDTKYFGKWSTSIHRTIEFVSESLFEGGVKFILLEGPDPDQTKAIIVNMKQELNKGKSFLLVGILPTKGTIGLAYQEMKDSAERIAKIIQENNFC